MGWPYQQKPPMGWPLDYDSGLVPNAGFWPMWEGSGGNTAADISGNGNTGTFAGLTSWTPGKYGSGIEMYGSEDWINVGNNPSLNCGYITIVAWIWPGGVSGGTYSTLWWDQLTGTRSRFMIGDDGTFVTQFTTAGGDYNEISASFVTMNVWSQVAFSWDGITGRHYVNGVLVYSKAEGGGVITSSANDRLIGMGQAAQYEFDGIIDHLMVYNHALSSSEIALLYQYPFCMFKDPAEVALLGGYQAVVGAAGIMTTNTGYWGPTF